MKTTGKCLTANKNITSERAAAKWLSYLIRQETTLSFVLGILTIYSIDWKKANITLFVILYFFEIFAQTKRILVEKTLSFDKYLLEIKMLALQGYSSTDISEIMREKYLK